jgi:hypothetical protein
VGNSASGNYATLGGGGYNTANGFYATVGGGDSNTVSGSHATVGGGQLNTVSGTIATVSGGSQNTASGGYATVGGGLFNAAAGDYSFVVGRNARNENAAHDGVFLFADSTNVVFNSVAANEFAVRASGGFRFRTSSDLSTGCNLPAGSGTFSCTSDRATKENIADVDPHEILQRVAALPIKTWNYKSQDASVRHIGPMAQDFYAAFGLGSGDKTISTIDLDGVALAAIQGLHQENLALKAENAALKTETAALKAEVAALGARLAAIEQALRAQGEAKP